jgi:hypothetical protein
MHGHHVRQVVRGDVDLPAVPVDQAHAQQTLTGRNGALVPAPPLGREPVTERVGEHGKPAPVVREEIRQFLRGDESTDRRPELSMIPPEGVKPRVGLDDPFALLESRRKRPRGDDGMRVGQASKSRWNSRPSSRKVAS